MRYYTFKTFRKRNNLHSEIEKWLNSLPVSGRAAIERRVSYLEVTLRWPMNYARKYKSHKKLYEIKVIHKNTQYRPLGFFGPGPREFTLLVGAEEHGDKLDPKNAPKLAVNRMDLINKDRGYLDDF